MTVLLNRTGRMYGYSAAGVFTDNFNRSDELLEADAKWAKLITTTQVANVLSNQLRFTTGVDFAATPYFEYSETLGKNQYAQLEWGAWGGATTLGAGGPVCRLTAGATDVNCYWGQVRVTSGSTYVIRLISRTDGSSTALGSDYSYTPTASDAIRVIANGTSISVTLNGSTVIGPVTNSDHASGKAGVASYIDRIGGTSTMDFDNFECGEV